MADLNFITDIVNNILSLFLPLLVFGTVILGLIVAYITGMFEKRPYKCYVWTERAGGALEGKHARGRYLKQGQGKFEMAYGIFDKQTITAPPEENIHPGDQLHFYRARKDDHFEIQSFRLSADKTKIVADPSWNNANKLALYQELEKNAHRFGNNPWEKYATHITFVIAIFIIVLAWYMSTNMIADSLNSVASNFAGVADKLADAQVVLEKQATATPAPPASGAPPG